MHGAHDRPPRAPPADQVREAARRLQAMIDAGDRPDIAQRALVHLYKRAHVTETLG